MQNKIGLVIMLNLGLVACGKSHQNDPAPTGTGGPTDSNTNPQIRYLGRVIPDGQGNALLSWPGAAVQVSTHATQLSVNLTLVASLTNANAGAVHIFIDGKPQAARLQLDPAKTSYDIAGLDGKQHTVTIVKATEAQNSDIQFGGFTGDIDPNGPTPPKRSIEFIGDSITVGFGIEGPAQDPNICPGDVYPFASDPNLSNTTKDYAFLTAQGFNADWSMIAYSGRGVYRNSDGSLDTANEPTLPTLWTMTDINMPGTPWSFPTQPTLVVINLGTNDFANSDSGTTLATLPDENGFVTAYGNFLKAINGKYPNVPIVVTIGPMLSDSQTVAGKPQLTTAQAYIKEAITASAVPNVSFFAYTPNNGQWTCDYHPDVAEAQIMTQQLMSFIRSSVSGWN